MFIRSSSHSFSFCLPRTLEISTGKLARFADGCSVVQVSLNPHTVFINPTHRLNEASRFRLSSCGVSVLLLVFSAGRDVCDGHRRQQEQTLTLTLHASGGEFCHLNLCVCVGERKRE